LPHFYFHTENGDCIRDDQGEDLPDIDAAQAAMPERGITPKETIEGAARPRLPDPSAPDLVQGARRAGEYPQAAAGPRWAGRKRRCSWFGLLDILSNDWSSIGAYGGNPKWASAGLHCVHNIHYERGELPWPC